MRGKFHFTVPKSEWKCDDLRVSGVLEAPGVKKQPAVQSGNERKWRMEVGHSQIPLLLRTAAGIAETLGTIRELVPEIVYNNRSLLSPSCSWTSRLKSAHLDQLSTISLSFQESSLDRTCCVVSYFS